MLLKDYTDKIVISLGIIMNNDLYRDHIRINDVSKYHFDIVTRLIDSNHDIKFVMYLFITEHSIILYRAYKCCARGFVVFVMWFGVFLLSRPFLCDVDDLQ